MLGINKNNFIVRNLNSAKLINKVTSPSAATLSVAFLITENNICRMYNSLTDKKEELKSRRYTACTDGLHELFCLGAIFALVPLFKNGGLKLGQKLFAKESFKNIRIDEIKALKMPAILKSLRQVAEDRLKSPARLKEETEKAAKKLNKQGSFGLFKSEINNVMSKVDKYNGNIEKNVRTAIFGDKPKEIIIETKQGLMKVTKAGIDDKSFVHKFLDETKDPEAITKGLKDKFITKFEDFNGLTEQEKQKKIKQLHEEGTHLFTPGKELIAETKEDDMRIKGSRGLGEAIGLAASIAVISPLFTGKYVPIVLKKLGLSGDNAKTKDVPNSSKEVQVTSKTINNCDEFLARNKKAS